MNNFDLFKMSIGSLLRRKLRTILTLLGVVIGTSSIVVMISLGIAMDLSFKESLKQMGSLNVIEVYPSYDMMPAMGSRGSEGVKLDDQAVRTLEQIPGVEAVMPSKNAYMRISAGKMVGDVSLIGINPELMEAFDFKLQKGRLLSVSDKDAIVFGQRVAFNFRNPRSRNQESVHIMFGPGPDMPEEPPLDLINDKMLLTWDMSYGERRSNKPDTDSDYTPPPPRKVKGVGILEGSFSEKAYSAYINLNTLEELLEEENKARHVDKSKQRKEDKYQNIKVKVSDIQQMESVQEKIKALGFQAHSLSDMVKSMKETSRKMQAILGGIGAVSLLVAAIGITNTMVMSIYERTREIGVMKVLGARLSDIRNLFLLEAAMIGLGGGCVGLLFSYLVSYILNRVTAGFMGNMGGNIGISVITWELGLAAVAFATMVGIISGYSPARRAMKLSALEAIRTE